MDWSSSPTTQTFLPRLGQQTHQFILAAVCVLILVDHDEFKLPVVAQPQSFIVFQQPDCFEQQIVEIECVRLLQALARIVRKSSPSALASDRWLALYQSTGVS